MEEPLEGTEINMELFNEMADVLKSHSLAFVHLFLQKVKFMPDVWDFLKNPENAKVLKDILRRLPHDTEYLVESKKTYMSILVQNGKLNPNDIKEIIGSFTNSTTLTKFLLSIYVSSRKVNQPG